MLGIVRAPSYVGIRTEWGIIRTLGL